MTEDIRRAIAGNVRAELARHGVTQREVAVVFGISQAQVSKRVLGEIGFSAVELLELAVMLDVPIERLMHVERSTIHVPAARDGDHERTPTAPAAGAPLDASPTTGRGPVGEGGSPTNDPLVGEPTTPARRDLDGSAGTSAVATTGGPDHQADEQRAADASATR